MSLIKQIAAKAAALPLDQQQKALSYIESLEVEKPVEAQVPLAFRSMFGIIPRQIENLEEDLAEVRREMWKNFPREDPK